MNRVKLPQDGQVIDTDSIIGAYWQDDPATRLIVRLEGMKDGLLFTGSDARALYEWLVANSTAIGEDGQEVATELRVDIHLSRSQVVLLKGMARYGSIAASRIVDISANLSSLEFSQLIEDGLIVKEDNDAIRIGNWYVITDIGRAAIEGK